MKAKNKTRAVQAELPRTFFSRLQAFFARPRVSAASFYFLAFAIPALMLHFVYVLLSHEDFLPQLTVLKIDMSFQYVYYFRALQDWIQGEGSIL